VAAAILAPGTATGSLAGEGYDMQERKPCPVTRWHILQADYGGVQPLLSQLRNPLLTVHCVRSMLP